MNKISVFNKLIDRALFLAWNKHISNNKPVGALLKELTPEERECLKDLTSEDTKKYRVLGL